MQVDPVRGDQLPGASSLAMTPMIREIFPIPIKFLLGL